MRRDRRLLWATGLLIVVALAGLVEAAIVGEFMWTAVMGGWPRFAERYGVEPPPANCLDYCAPDLLFLAGWIAIGCFLLALALVTWAWLRPLR